MLRFRADDEGNPIRRCANTDRGHGSADGEINQLQRRGRAANHGEVASVRTDHRLPKGDGLQLNCLLYVPIDRTVDINGTPFDQCIQVGAIGRPKLVPRIDPAHDMPAGVDAGDDIACIGVAA